MPTLRRQLAAALLAAALLGVVPASAEDAMHEVCVLETTHGTMVFRFFDEAAPRTSAHFKKLVREGFYDGLTFYRVVAGHVIQAGNVDGLPERTVAAEVGAHPHLAGTVGLARDEDPDSGSTEFYVCLEPRPHLDGHYTVFGQLVEGDDVLAAIGAVAVEEKFLGDARKVAFHEPKEPVVIRRAYLETRQLAPAAAEESDETP